MATFLEEWEEEHKLFKDPPEDHVDFDKVNKKLKEFRNIENPTKKDFNEMFTWINKFEQQVPIKNIPITGPLFGKTRAELRDKFNEAYPDRETGYNYESFIEAYKEEDPKKREKELARLRTQFDPNIHTPHLERGRPFVESDVTMAIKKGREKLPEPKYEGPFGKIGEYFSKNAAARDKLFSMMGSMGRELVKPIQPGQAAAGALLPTLSRGLGKGETEYAAKQAAGAKTALDMATAQQKINPLQYYTTKMTEARLAVPKHIDPDSAEGKRWIGKYLVSVGIPGQVVDLTSSLESLNLQLLSASNDEEKKRIQGLVDQINRQLQDVISQSIGGSSVTSVIDYSTLTGL